MSYDLLMVILHIDYTEGDQKSYRGMYATQGQEVIASVYSGDPIVDWTELKDNLRGYVKYLSSSCDHFVQDGDAYRWHDYLGLVSNDL